MKGTDSMGPVGVDPAAGGRTSGVVSRLSEWPRTRLASLPTPLVPARRLAAELGVPDLLVKMDAETGFALGGNKVRKLEFELSPDRVRDVTCLITAGGPQSNHCRVTAALAARWGMRCVLVTQESPSGRPAGNALLHRLFGAESHTVPDRDARVPAMEDVAREVERNGGRPLVVPIGASTGVGSLGYALAAVELTAQLDEIGARPDRTLLFVPTSSCGTLAGLVLGLAILGRKDVVPVGVSADVAADEIRERTLIIAREGAELLDAEVRMGERSLIAVDAQVGQGYGIPTDASTEATALFGRLEGMVLDPTYTAKAAAGMIDFIREGGVASRDRIVFLHTGGHPALFA